MILAGVFFVGLLAGFVDAIAGGGGLIMLPGLLVTGLPVGNAIASNKLCGTCGAIISSFKFAHARQVNWRICQLMSIPIIAGSHLGSRSIGLLPSTWAEPLIIVLMIIITLFVLFKPNFGKDAPAVNAEAHSTITPKQMIVGLFASGVIGFHDGFFGPGTGIFLVFVLLSLWSQGFLKATGSTKVLNLLANATALATFAIAGNIDYSKGIIGAIGVGIGSFIGATFATKKGAKIIKPLFIAVTVSLIVKLLIDYLLS
ncbi:MAG: TSUP family transporter [Cyanobacteria bacterium J06649_4]